MITYRLRATALCPVDGSRDHYDVELRSEHQIEVGELRAWFDERANHELFQEALTALAAAHFKGSVSLMGQHPSPVEVLT